MAFWGRICKPSLSTVRTGQVQHKWIVWIPLRVSFLGVENFSHLDFSRWLLGPMEPQDVMITGRDSVPLVLRRSRPLDFPLASMWDAASSSPPSALRILFHSCKSRSFYGCVCFAVSLDISTHESKTRRASLKTSQWHTLLKFNVSLNVEGCQIWSIHVVTKEDRTNFNGILFSYFAVAL